MKHARIVLLPFSFLYGLTVLVRNWFFDIGILKTTRVRVPVISVGNLSTGGTGKTPFIEMLVERLNDHRVSVVSRGYGRISTGTIVVNDGRGSLASVEEAGDEPSQLAKKYPTLLIIADEQRVRGAEKAIELGTDIVLLDDGFQHRYLHRDLNIVMMTAEEILKDDWLLPAGNRREPMSSLRRSDCIVISRCESLNDFHRAAQVVQSMQKPVLGLQMTRKSFWNLWTDEKIKNEFCAGKKIVAVSAIGNPKSFESFLMESGMVLMKHFVFPDHHWFTESEMKKIARTKKGLNAEYIVTTEKDAVRIRERYRGLLEEDQLMVLGIQQKIISEDKTLDMMLQRILKN
jgi:tetraacyldisaccharide 4'-kinase